MSKRIKVPKVDWEMKKKIRIEKVSTLGTVIAFVLTFVFLGIAVWSWGEFMQ